MEDVEKSFMFVFLVLITVCIIAIGIQQNEMVQNVDKIKAQITASILQEKR